MSSNQMSATSKFIGTAAVFLLIIGFVGCSSDNITSQQTPTRDDLLQVVENPIFIQYAKSGENDLKPQLSMGDPTTVNIGPEGGTIQNGPVTLIFPEGAVDNLDCSITLTDQYLLLIEMGPHGSQFNAPVILRLDLRVTSEENNAANCSILWFDDKGELWMLMPTAIPDANTIEAELWHFSKFGGALG